MRQDEHGNLIADDGTLYEYSGMGNAIDLTSDGEISFGFDSKIHHWPDAEDDLQETNGLYEKHRKELAEYMIAKWTAFRDGKK